MHKKLPSKYYFIKSYDTHYIAKLDKNTGIIFRNYDLRINLKSLLKLKNYCKYRGNKFYLSNHIKLAINLKLDGAYIPSFNKDLSHLAYSLRQDFLILGSAHNYKEIHIKQQQKVDMLFLSSLFKKNKNYLGVNKFKTLTNLSSKNIIALGGISKKNITKLKLLNCFGFAGISYFE